MFKISIIKNSQVTNSCTAPEAEAMAWLAKHEGMGTFGDPESYTVEVTDISAQLAQEATNAGAIAYLASTDWYVLREVGGGQECPTEIEDERAAARLRIVR